MKVIRWIIIVLAAITFASVGFGALLGNATSSDLGAVFFWLIAGSIAVYYERKANLKKPKS